MKMNILIIIVAIVATCITYYISINLNKGAVFASAVITLIGGIIFPYIFPEGGGILAAVGACGSYAGMATKEKFPSMMDMVFVGLICGSVFILSSNAYVGVGGRLGTMAAISGFTWLGIKKLRERSKGAKSS